MSGHILPHYVVIFTISIVFFSSPLTSAHPFEDLLLFSSGAAHASNQMKPVVETPAPEVKETTESSEQDADVWFEPLDEYGESGDDEDDDEFMRSYMEEGMGKRSPYLLAMKRSMALGRTSLRPGKRSMALGRHSFRPGKRSMAIGRAYFRPGKRSAEELTEERDKKSMALGRISFRPGKRSAAVARMNFRPGKRSAAIGRIKFRPGKRFDLLNI